MKRAFLLIIGLFIAGASAFSQNVHGDAGTRVSTGFNVATAMPVDANSVYEKLADTTAITKKYESKTVWFRDVKQFYTWTGKAWKQNSGGASLPVAYSGTYNMTKAAPPANDPATYPYHQARTPFTFAAPFASRLYRLQISCSNYRGTVPYVITDQKRESFTIDVAEPCTCTWEAK